MLSKIFRMPVNVSDIDEIAKEFKSRKFITAETAYRFLGGKKALLRKNERYVIYIDFEGDLHISETTLSTEQMEIRLKELMNLG